MTFTHGGFPDPEEDHREELRRRALEGFGMPQNSRKKPKHPLEAAADLVASWDKLTAGMHDDGGAGTLSLVGWRRGLAVYSASIPYGGGMPGDSH